MTGEAQKGSGVDLLFAVWSRRKWLAILVFAAPFSAAVSLITFLPNIYRSTATVAWRGPRTSVCLSSSLMSARMRSMTSSEGTCFLRSG